ncbi:MAG: TIGR03960 family B12-binding radical SAM protein [Acidobacteria bacterium]|nr:TIGR03960 family B12-binding radical SAM protein [Acidobacteriota bacterium]
MARSWTDLARVHAELDRMLVELEKPTRYIGGEWNSVAKSPAEVDVAIALAFPDVYEIGMSHLGFRILYALLNDLPGVAAERAFMPWIDMLARLRERDLPLVTLETRRPLSAFDMVGFSMQHELTITNVLAMLDQGGVPLLAAERREGDPLVLAGGPAIFNPEPFADFFDLVLVGDAEEALPEALDLYKQMRGAGAPRLEIVRAVARTGGWYAPQLYEARPEPLLGMLIPRPRPGEDVPARVRRRVVYDLNRYPFPEKIVVPHAEIVHDRVSWEIMRGCPVGCRFCQAGYVYRPTRERDPAAVLAGVRRSIDSTGYDEFSLTSLNTGEYGAIEPLLAALMDEMEPRRVSVGLSSLHATTMTETLAAQVKRVRKTGFTLAPEAGSQRLRDVINKNLNEADILNATRLAFEAGWQLMKLYFMIGLPTETDEDIDALVDLGRRILRQGREIGGNRVRLTLSASTFVPKVFTPFQWFGMQAESDFRAKQDRIRRGVPRGIEFRYHNHGESWLEGVFSRADRRLGPAVLEAYRRGAVLDSWSDHLRLDIWRAVFAEQGLDADGLATRPIPLEAELPWEVVDPLVRRKWLEVEYRRALEAGTMATCATACTGCAPFSTECVKGEVAAQRWTDFDTHPGGRLPAYHVERAPEGRGLGREPEPPAAEHESPPAEPQAAPAAAPPRPLYRYRARFEKLGRSRFLGHLDMVRAVGMALRRAGVPLAYSQGFKPHPRMSFSHALSLGVASRSEYVDFDTNEPLDTEATMSAVNATMPEGLRLTAVVAADPKAPALQDAITRGRYRAELPGLPRAELERRAREFLERDTAEIVRRRKGKERRVDLRQLVESLCAPADGQLEFTLLLGGPAAPRIQEVLDVVLGPGAPPVEVVRLEQTAESGGRPVSPLLAGRIGAALPRD